MYPEWDRGKECPSLCRVWTGEDRIRWGAPSSLSKSPSVSGMTRSYSRQTLQVNLSNPLLPESRGAQQSDHRAFGSRRHLRITMNLFREDFFFGCVLSPVSVSCFLRTMVVRSCGVKGTRSGRGGL